ncbi:MAG: putative oxidoreductase [Cyclobacteriaceae bacterium]|jgi:putative oxidoreductase
MCCVFSWHLCLLNSGFNKFFNYMPVPDMKAGATLLMMAFSKSGWVLSLVGIVEIVSGILFALPKYRALGAIVLLPVVVGILVFHLVQEPNGNPVGIILSALNGYIIFEKLDRYKPMIK